MARRTVHSSPPPAPVSAADQARFDAVTTCRSRVEEYKRVGVDPAVLESAVEALQAAIAAAPDMPPPLPPVPVEESEPESDDASEADRPADDQEN